MLVLILGVLTILLRFFAQVPIGQGNCASITAIGGAVLFVWDGSPGRAKIGMHARVGRVLEGKSPANPPLWRPVVHTVGDAVQVASPLYMVVLGIGVAYVCVNGLSVRNRRRTGWCVWCGYPAPNEAEEAGERVRPECGRPPR